MKFFNIIMNRMPVNNLSSESKLIYFIREEKKVDKSKLIVLLHHCETTSQQGRRGTCTLKIKKEKGLLKKRKKERENWKLNKEWSN